MSVWLNFKIIWRYWRLKLKLNDFFGKRIVCTTLAKPCRGTPALHPVDLCMLQWPEPVINWNFAVRRRKQWHQLWTTKKKYNSKSQAESHLHFGLMICWLQFILWETLLGFLRHVHVSMQNSNSGEVLALSQVIPNLSSRRALQTSNLAPRQHGRRTSCRDKAAEPVDHGVAWTLEKLVKFKRDRMGCPAPTEAAHTHTTSGKGDKKGPY